MFLGVLDQEKWAKWTTIWTVWTLDHIWANSSKSRQNFSRSGQKKHSQLNSQFLVSIPCKIQTDMSRLVSVQFIMNTFYVFIYFSGIDIACSLSMGILWCLMMAETSCMYLTVLSNIQSLSLSKLLCFVSGPLQQNDQVEYGPLGARL